ncbi:winged helix-turn-helix domain-containing protein [Candidatus Lokiarchaeum ossiferum]|uniref:winged helix-turn-helix domain-containing protein n=1 Tax=Candidatus Lokiarchaeum ossiferum TaxID=2951803 RepID=UPI00352F2A79
MAAFEPELQKEFTEPDVVTCLFHDKRQQILSVLISEEMTVYDLKTALKMNPGVVKRHIDLLLDRGLIKQTRTDQNKMGMTLKYYRAVAIKYIVHLEWETR